MKMIVTSISYTLVGEESQKKISIFCKRGHMSFECSKDIKVSYTRCVWRSSAKLSYPVSDKLLHRLKPAKPLEAKEKEESY